jgi:hypothetical protein
MVNEILISLITSVITWSILLIGQKIIIPFYESLVYKGIIIKGIWNHQSTLNEQGLERVTFTETLTIEQKAHNLTGTYAVTNITSGQNNMTSVYKINGKILNNHIYLTAEIENNNQIGLATFLFSVVSGGGQLIGSVSILNRAADNILTFSNLTYTRQ